jgi:GABA(A) receptor-associated protein
MNNTDFKSSFTFDQRLKESIKIREKFPDKIPIICQRSIYAEDDCPILNKRKYLVSSCTTIAHFIFIIRKLLNLNSEKSLFLFVEGNSLPCSYTIEHVYDIYKDNDYFLYVTYTFENTFG